MFKNLTSETIGKIKTAALIAAALIIAALTLWILYLELAVIPILKSKNTVLEAQKKSSENIVALQSTAAELSKADEKKKEQLPYRLMKIEKVLVPVYPDIEIKKGVENNATYECNHSSHFWDFDAVGVFNSAATAADH